MQYEYPTMTGYRWNVLQKISIALNIPMSDIYTSDTGTHSYVGFNNMDLTIEQKSILDNIMTNNPCLPPDNIGNTTFEIADLWSMRQWFSSQWGIKPTMWFEEGNDDGSGECHIYLQFPKMLTLTEKEQIVSVYGKAIKEMV